MAIRLDYAVQESVTNMRRNLFMSFAAVLVVTIALALFGAVFIFRAAIARTADVATRQVRVTVFLVDDITSSQRDEIHNDLEAMPEVADVIYESKEEAYERFKILFANEPALVENTRPDALPESFRVQLKNPETFQIVKDSFDGRPGVYQIRDEREIVEQLFATARFARAIGLGIAIAVGAAALVLIATTIRMAIYARRREIGIMKLVGATNWFIRVPFMMEGVVQGIAGALVAFAILLAFKPLFAAVNPAGAVSVAAGLVVTWTDVAIHGLYMIGAGIFVGAVGSLVGLRKFLDV